MPPLSLGIGLGLTMERAVGGGGPSPYVAKAVHFGSGAWLDLAALIASNSPVVTMSAWVKATTYTGGDSFNPAIFYDLGPSDFAADFSLQTSSGQVNVNVSDQVAASAQWISDGAVFRFDAWDHWLLSYDTNHGDGLKLVGLYQTDTHLTGTWPSDGNGPFSTPWSGLEIAVPDTDADMDPSKFLLGDRADLMIFPGVKIVKADGTIDEADRRNFISAIGKPVNPSVAVAAYGNAAVLLSGDKDTFATNQGTGGAFTLTGALTNASSSPSD